MNQVATIDGRATELPQTADQVRSHVHRIQEVMKAVMKSDTHYGEIPGTKKPTLYKAGSEVLLTTFHIAVEPEVDDLSTIDEIRYRVRAVGRHQSTGIIVGIGIGECSSSEEKYKWRASVCDEEFDDTDPARRRTKYAWKWGQERGEKVHYKVKQVRVEPADVANTILKMAKKRAQIDLTLTALAASDIFTQDAEDLPEGMQHVADDAPRGKPATAAPKAKNANADRPATDKQKDLIRKKLGDMSEEDFCKQLGIESIDTLPFSKVNDGLALLTNTE